MKVLSLLLLINIFVVYCDGKVYTRCGLAHELARRRVERSFISNWVCLIESESGKDTSKITRKANGSKSYGLFQINSREWCANGREGGKCNIACEDLIDEDISDDIECAHQIWDQQGFRSWDGWRRGCRSFGLQKLSRVFIRPCNPPV